MLKCVLALHCVHYTDTATYCRHFKLESKLGFQLLYSYRIAVKALMLVQRRPGSMLNECRLNACPWQFPGRFGSGRHSRKWECTKCSGAIGPLQLPQNFGPALVPIFSCGPARAKARWSSPARSHEQSEM